jgi:hypothetical protein
MIEQLELIDQPLAGTYIFKTGQRIQYFGEVIPEPSTTAMLLLAIGQSAMFAIRRRRRSN